MAEKKLDEREQPRRERPVERKSADLTRRSTQNEETARRRNRAQLMRDMNRARRMK